MKIILAILLVVPHLILAQDLNLWSEAISPNARTSDSWTGITVNRKTLNHEALDILLDEIKKSGKAQISIPHPSGSEMNFTIQPTNLMAPELQKKHPEIQVFKGLSTNGTLVRIDISPMGMHATVYDHEGNIYLDPESDGSDEYLSHFASDRVMDNTEVGGCEQEEIPSSVLKETQSRVSATNFNKRTVGNELKKYRIAITAHHTFTTRVGSSNALSTIVTILNRTTGLFEIEVAVTFELIANNDLLIMTSSSPGPFSSLGIAELLRLENQTFTDETIGEENYDLGHIVGGSSSGGGGIASFQSVCVSGRKAATASSFLFTISNLDPFIEVFKHEIGHQFGAYHTFTSGQSCSFGVSQWNQRASYEIGSGNTIMSYAGICGDNNVASSREEYFHAISIENILDFIENKATCWESIQTGNTPPTVSIREGGFTIPINTPFVLEASGSDQDNDNLTYSWEQLDQATKMEDRPGSAYSSVSEISYFSEEEFINGDEYEAREELEALVLGDGSTLPESTIQFVLDQQQKYIDAMFEGDGPLFRNFLPTTDNKRYFPAISKVLTGATSIQESVFEVLPFKTRDLNFVITVRDNNVDGGGMTNDLISFSSTDEAGPFVVTSEFSDLSYAGLSNFELQWDVANTNVSPVNCQTVDILYSTDGGENFDITILSATGNDGAETIKIPNIKTSEGRFMIKAVGNVFYNVNSTNLSVTPSEADIPEAPTALIVDQFYFSSVTLSWEDNSSTEDGFIIERQEESDDFVEITRVQFDQPSYIDETIAIATEYTYRIAAYNAEGTSVYSNTVTVEIPSPQPNDILAFALSEQTGAAIIDVTNHTIAIEVATGTDLTALIPMITLSEGASSSPATNVAIDFTNPVVYSVMPSDGGTNQDWIVTVTVEEENDEVLETKDDLEWVVYPNPASDFVYIDAPETITVSLMDINGRLMMSNLVGKNLQLDISSFDHGMYLLIIQQGVHITKRKIVKVQ